MAQHHSFAMSAEADPADRPGLTGRGGLASALLSLLVVILVCGSAVGYRTSAQTAAYERVIEEKSNKIYRVISSLLYKTHILAAIVVQNNGQVRDFDRIATYLLDDPAIMNILLAPGGVVSYIQPLYGNEEAFGFNMFGAGAGNLEAIRAREQGHLVFGGPFELIQGGKALVGRLPIYLGKPGEGRVFWGLASVTLKFPEALDGVELGTLAEQGLGYEIWRINPDDGKRQVIASGGDYRPGDRYLERHVKILNADWYFKVIPITPWYAQAANLLLLGGGLLIWIFFCLALISNRKLRSMHRSVRLMAMTDPLTGILNRRGLFERIEELIAAKEPFRLYYLDLNYFKQINDVHGHGVGDAVLKEFCARVRRHLTMDHVFGRMSGDEFVLLRLTGPGAKPHGERFREALRLEFDAPLVVGELELHISFSSGMSVFPAEGHSVDGLISLADQRMYAYKNEKYRQERRRRSADWAARPDGGAERPARPH